MRKTKYIVNPTTQFKKDYKLALKRRRDVSAIESKVMAMYSKGIE